MKKLEAFTIASFPNDSSSAGTRDIKKYYSKTLPNIIYNNDPLINLADITKTANVRFSNSTSVLDNDWKKNINILTNNELNQQQSACQGSGSGDQFEHLTSLASSFDTNSRLRCGWMYNTTNYTQGRGALGINNGPLKTTASGDWMWDLNAAKKRYHTDICSRINDCGDIGADIYKGPQGQARCGWCTQTGRPVPINANGTAAYPFDDNTACPSSKLLTSSASCTQGFTNPKNIQGFTNPSACTALANGAFSRDCLLQKVVGAGCSDAGTLYQALQSGSDNDYTNVLRKQPAWSIYQERAVLPLDDTALKSGKITITNALNNFNRVQQHASSPLNGGLQYAARDLCFKNGEMDAYDFCSEISDSSNGPFSLDCLQKSFLKAGGQKTGTAYPSEPNIREWNSIGSWSQVKNIIQMIKENTKSTSRPIQENAMLSFYGIRLEDKKEPSKINVTEASYGINCDPSLKGNRTALFKDLINDNTDFKNYLYNSAKTGGDPAPGCPKTLQVKYSCQGGPIRTFTSPDAGINTRIKLSCPLPASVTQNLSVRLGEHCGRDAGWQKNIGIGDFSAGSEFPGDASYITVPEGLTVTLTNDSGQKYVVEGPDEFNFCSRNGFNDRVRRIQVVPT